MNLNDLARALDDYSDGFLVEGPFPASGAGREFFELHISARLGDGRDVTVTSDGTVRWVDTPAGGPHRPVRRRLPADVAQAAERIAALVWAR